VLLKRLYALVFIEHGTRRMHLGGVTANPAGEKLRQGLGRALTAWSRQRSIRGPVAGVGTNVTGTGVPRAFGIAQDLRQARRQARPVVREKSSSWIQGRFSLFRGLRSALTRYQAVVIASADSQDVWISGAAARRAVAQRFALGLGQVAVQREQFQPDLLDSAKDRAKLSCSLSLAAAPDSASATSKIRAACSVRSVRSPGHRHGRDRRREATGSHAVDGRRT
jgi:hypothetical protein